MTSNQFWQIVDATRAATQEEQLEMFRQQLRRLAPEELIDFQRIFTERFFAAYNWDLWVVAWLCEGGLCSDDSFMDFRTWLISRGRAVYEAALQNPDSLTDEMRQTGHRAFELFSYGTGEIYGESAGENFPDLGVEHPKEPTGGDWLRPALKDRSNSNILNLSVVFSEMGDEEYQAIQQRFPRIWAFCVEQGIITTGASTPSASEIPSPEQVARTVDPDLATADFAAYLKALGDAGRQAYKPKE
jgi:hypothetical protein